jgi:hypothetical protein
LAGALEIEPFCRVYAEILVLELAALVRATSSRYPLRRRGVASMTYDPRARYRH